MKHLLLAAISIAMAAAMGMCASAQATDLLEVYQKALENDPQLREAQALRMATRENRPQALSALLPQISLTGQALKTESEGSAYTFTTTGGALPIVRKQSLDGTGYIAELRQSIFRWENWMTLKRADKEVAQAEADFSTAQQDLITRVSERYFGVLAAQNELEAQQSAAEAISRQLEQANKRFEVGLIAITDVQEAKAAYDSANAAVIAGKRALATSQELLREITGQEFTVFNRPSENMPLQPPALSDAEQWIALALEQNPRVISSRLAAEIAGDNIKIARGGHYPDVGLSISRNKLDLSGDQTTAAGTFPADSDSTEDQIALQVTIPIFSGGLTSSRVRQAGHLQTAAQQRLQRAMRETQRGMRDAYLGVVSEISRVQALRQALESSRTALQATEAGYEVGTRTAVDVLDARRALVQAETAYASSRYEYLLNLLRLKLAAGTLSLQDVQQVNGWLEPPAAPKTAPAP